MKDFVKNVKKQAGTVDQSEADKWAQNIMDDSPTVADMIGRLNGLLGGGAKGNNNKGKGKNMNPKKKNPRSNL